MRLALVSLLLAIVVSGCTRPAEEPVVVRLLDLAPDAASSWPRQLGRRLPKQIEGVRTARELRTKKVARIAMFPIAGGDSRLSLVAPSGTRHRFTLVLPQHAVLRLGLGYLPSPEAEGVDVEFVVRIEPLAPGSDSNAETVVVDRSFTVTATDGWRDEEVDLSRWSGERVALSLETRSSGTDARVWTAWSAPEVISRGRSQSSPDVILISLDTLRADRLGCYGYPLNTSPNLDELAAGGIRFHRAMSQAPWTLPSHKSIFSGLYVSARDIDQAPTMADLFRAHGFRTEAVTGGGQMDFRMGFGSGFDGYRVFDWIRDLSWLEQWLAASTGRRRFLFLHTYEIHDPYIHTSFAKGKEAGRVAGHFGRNRFWGLERRLTPVEKEYVSSLYDGGIAYTDMQLGKLFSMLERSGAMQRSIVVVTSDHGEQFWEHGRWRHGMSLHDHQLLVPLIVHLPDELKESLASDAGLSGKTFEQQVRLVDLLPTLLELLDIQLEHPVDGRSLVPLLEGRELPAADALAERLNLEHLDSMALRSDRYKFIYSYPKPSGLERGFGESRELFDLVNDPGEQRNLIDRYPEQAAELEARLQAELAPPASADHASEPARELDPDLEDRLRALGYLD